AGWHYTKNHQKEGPVGLERLIELLECGQLQPDDLVLAHGSSKWVPIRSIGAESPPAETPSPAVTEPVAAAPEPKKLPPAVAVPVALQPTHNAEPAAALPEPTPTVAAPIALEPAPKTPTPESRAAPVETTPAAVAAATAVAVAEVPVAVPREQP